jgi:hypothetical protein
VEQGVRLEPFDYTLKKVLSLKKSTKLITDEVLRIRTLKRDTKGWVLNPRVEGTLYANDPVGMVKSVGKKTAKLLESNDIKTVADLLTLDVVKMKQIAQTTKGLTVASLQRFVHYCADASSENAPEITYFIDSDNPYAARYGEEEDEWGQPAWKTIIKKSTTFTGVVCITDLIKHMVVQTKKCYEDTEYHDTYMFYHDALTQLTSKVTVDWMKKQKIPGETKMVYDRWIRPLFNLNDHLGCFKGRPPGDSAEFMPLDNSLNQDVHNAVKKHCLLSMTIHDPNNPHDDRLFSMATPKEAARCYERICDPVTGVAPSSKRILEDVKRVINAFHVVFKHEGAYVEGLAGGRVAGKRHHATTRAIKPRGGRRVRMEYNDLLATADIEPRLLEALNQNESALRKTRYARKQEEEELDDDGVEDDSDSEDDDDSEDDYDREEDDDDAV